MRTKNQTDSCLSSGEGFCLMAGIGDVDSGLLGSLFLLLRY